MNDQHADRADALQVTNTLRDAGYQALWAGGCVRDMKLDRQRDADIDIATDATPDQIRELFGEHRTIAVGAAFGVIMVLTGDRKAIEVATFRQDAGYSDGRHPDSVTFTSAREDALRRDFTINGMFYDPVKEEFIDLVDGQSDLDASLIRAIGNAEQRFAEDKLRLLRAVRFAASLEFTIEPSTWSAIQQHAAEISAVSAERIQKELRQILEDPQRTTGLQLLRDSGLLAAILPELTSAPLTAWTQLEATLEKLPDPGFAMVMAACCLSLAADTEMDSAYDRLKLSNHDRQLINWLCQQLPQLIELHHRPWPEAQQLLVDPRIDDLMVLAEAHQSACQGDLHWLAFCQDKLALPSEELNPEAFISGDDLLAAGIPAGPAFREILEQVRNAQLEGRIIDRQQALTLAQQLAAEG